MQYLNYPFILSVYGLKEINHFDRYKNKHRYLLFNDPLNFKPVSLTVKSIERAGRIQGFPRLKKHLFYHMKYKTTLKKGELHDSGIKNR